jgi:hypothetical protein
MSSRMLLVDPSRLLVVTVRVGQDTLNYLALSCSYVVAHGNARPASVAVEILFDPAHNEPSEPYYCPPNRVRRERVAPGSVVRVRPYLR